MSVALTVMTGAFFSMMATLGAHFDGLPQVFDASVLSDEATAPGQPNFTGAFVGMACHDTSGGGHHADFDWFEYRERDYLPSIER